MTPKIHLTAFPDRVGQFIFVAVPDERGRYLRTDRSVALVSCRHCGSVSGEPCKGKPGYHGATHVGRRADAQRLDFSVRRSADDILAPPFRTPEEWLEPSS